MSDKSEKQGKKKPEIIRVISGWDNNRVAFFEKNDQHPDGEAFVAGTTPDDVAYIGTVAAALRDGRLIKVDDDYVDPNAPKPAEETQPKKKGNGNGKKEQAQNPPPDDSKKKPAGEGDTVKKEK